MVIYGLVEESASRAAKEGWIEQDPKYPHAHETHWFDPEGMRIVWQRMLDEAGVRTFCNVFAGTPLYNDGRLIGVASDTKTGRCAFTAPLLIDATGDGDLVAGSGVPFIVGRSSDGLVQGMTLMFSLSGIDTEAATKTSDAQMDDIVAKMRELQAAGRFPPFNEGNCRSLLRWGRNHFLWNMLPAAGNPLNEEELSKLTAGARVTLVKYLNFWRSSFPGYREAKIAQTGFAMGVRESRRIRGVKTLDKEMVLGAKKHSDALGHGVWMVDIHDPEGSGYTTFTDSGPENMLRTGESYHIPYGMCLNSKHRNLAVAGRCASSTHEGHSSVRVQTHCMVMGQGVGTATAMALETGTDFHGVDISGLKKTLIQDGVYIS